MMRMPIDPRALELGLGILILTRGAALLWPGVSMTEPIYSSYLELTSEPIWGLIYLCAGLFTVAGVIINGRHHRSPFLRRSGAAVSFVVWSMLATTFYANSLLEVSLAAVLYSVLAVLSFWCIFAIEGKTGAGH